MNYCKYSDIIFVQYDLESENNDFDHYPFKDGEKVLSFMDVMMYEYSLDHTCI